MNRALSYLVALLILINVAVLLWPEKAVDAPHVYPAKADVSPHYVRLNQEIEERFYSESIDGVKKLQASTDSLSKVPLDIIDKSSGECYRVGPFLHEANYELAQAVLFNAGVGYHKSTRESIASNVFRVYLGPFSTDAEASEARRELNVSGVKDHFIRKQDDGSMVISLGIYSTEESASDALESFGERVDGIQSRSENVVLPNSYWLHFAATDDGRLLSQLDVIDWGEPSAKMGLFSCDF